MRAWTLLRIGEWACAFAAQRGHPPPHAQRAGADAARGALTWFYPCIFLLGLGGANFALYTLWLPEQYPTDCRASAVAFISSVGRFVGVAMVFLVGSGIQSYGSLGIPVAITAIAFVFGLILVPMSEETRGKSLPA